MGLDGVELIMACEEEFGIDLPDSEVWECTTPEKLSDLICRKLDARQEVPCASQRAFYRLRRALVQTWQVSRNQIKPETEVIELLGNRSMPQAWDDLRATLGGHCWPESVHPGWPELVRPGWLVVLIGVAALGIMGAAVIAGSAGLHPLVTAAGAPGPLFYGMLVGISGVLTAYVGFTLTARCRTKLPGKELKVRELLPYVPTEPEQPWTRGQVALRVMAITVEQLGLKPGQYRPDAEFVRDLGVD